MTAPRPVDRSSSYDRSRSYGPASRSANSADTARTYSSSFMPQRAQHIPSTEPLPQQAAPLGGTTTDPIGIPDSNLDGEKVNGKEILQEEDAYEVLAYAWSPWKKWILLTVVAVCQTSMNFNASIYNNAVESINEDFNTTRGRHGMIAFLVAYAFGCEIWAPWSEELGRYSIMQSSLSLVNVSILICALSQNFGTMMTGRVIGGLSSAGGSVTLGMVADMFTPDEQQHAVLWASMWSCLGSVLGGICGGPIQQYAPTWRWIFWIQLIFGGFTQLLHAVVAKESRVTALLDREAKKRREVGIEVYGPNEARTKRERFAFKEMMATMLRPYKMLLTEPIVLCLSLLSGFADALIFMFFESYGYVFAQWDYSPTQISLVLITLGGAYLLGYFSFFPIIRRHNQQRRAGQVLAPETRLYWLLYLVVLLPIGLFVCAFIGTRSPIAVAIVTIPIGMANYAIYFATIDYMVECYGPYSASATGGNGFARDFLAGICAIYTKPMFDNLGIQKTYFVLFAFAALFCIPVYVFYWKGPEVRARSKFAKKLEWLAELRKEKLERKASQVRRAEDTSALTSSSDVGMMRVAPKFEPPA